MSIKLEDQLPTLSKKRRFSKKELAAPQGKVGSQFNHE